MSASVGKKFQAQGLSSSLKIEVETVLVQKKQGIVTILACDSERNRDAAAAANSLRRTLSADMSSKKWLSQNGASPIKKIASSDELSHSKFIADAETLPSSEGEDEYEEMKELLDAEAERERFQIWSSIQRDKKEQHEKPGQLDTWSSILSLKAKDETSKSLPIPYIHPPVKRSKSSLSEKGLEICTESLGSETGSDGFSSYPPSETGENAEEDKEEEEQQQQPQKVTMQEQEEEYLQVPKYNYAAATKKSSLRCFPPPLPSLSRQDGPSLHMRTHRDNGRLFLDAVSLPSQNNFCAQRQDGRLVLTFASDPDDEESKEDDGKVDEIEEEHDHMEELEEEFEGFEKDDEEKKENQENEDDETEEEDIEEIEQARVLSSGIKSVHRLALMMNKPIGLVNTNPNWSEKFNEVVSFEDVNVVEPSPVAQSLPPRPGVSRLIPSTQSVASVATVSAASFNAYENYWRTKPTEKGATVQQNNNSNSPLKNYSSKLIFSGDIYQAANEKQQLLVLKGKNGDYLVHNLKGCKDSRRSFLFWEPYCIAT